MAAAPDVLIVGAGPAGAATAILLARQGFAVTLLDRARFPRDKVCGEYLSPEGARILDRLGVLAAVEQAGARPLSGMRIHAPDGTALQGDYPAAGPWRGFRDHALAVRRRQLDAALVARARALGVTVREGVRVTDVHVTGGRVTGVAAATVDGGVPPGAGTVLAAPLVVGADGRGSVITERLGLRRPHPWLRRLALVADVEGADCDPARGEVFVAPPAYAIMNPVEDACVNLSLVVPVATARMQKRDLPGYFDRTVRAWPKLATRLGSARRLGPVRAVGPLAYRVAPPALGGVLLVGDAAGFLDPFTGEGLYTALRSAEHAAETAGAALRAGDLSAAALRPVAARRATEFAAKTRLTALLQRLIRHRSASVMSARLLARRPEHLALVMGVLGDFVPPRALVAPAFLATLLWPRGLATGTAVR